MLPLVVSYFLVPEAVWYLVMGSGDRSKKTKIFCEKKTKVWESNHFKYGHYSQSISSVNDTNGATGRLIHSALFGMKTKIQITP